MTTRILWLMQSIRWATGNCTISASTSIHINHDSLQGEAAFLQAQLLAEGIATNLSQGKVVKKRAIRLVIAEVKAPRNVAEAYQLTVCNDEIILKANTRQGLFNGIQTLLQLMQPYHLCCRRDKPDVRFRH